MLKDHGMCNSIRCFAVVVVPVIVVASYAFDMVLFAVAGTPDCFGTGQGA